LFISPFLADLVNREIVVPRFVEILSVGVIGGGYSTALAFLKRSTSRDAQEKLETSPGQRHACARTFMTKEIRFCLEVDEAPSLPGAYAMAIELSDEVAVTFSGRAQAVGLFLTDALLQI
jgi:hypothetical protein